MNSSADGKIWQDTWDETQHLEPGPVLEEAMKAGVGFLRHVLHLNWALSHSKCSVSGYIHSLTDFAFIYRYQSGSSNWRIIKVYWGQMSGESSGYPFKTQKRWFLNRTVVESQVDEGDLRPLGGWVFGALCELVDLQGCWRLSLKHTALVKCKYLAIIKSLKTVQGLCGRHDFTRSLSVATSGLSFEASRGEELHSAFRDSICWTMKLCSPPATLRLTKMELNEAARISVWCHSLIAVSFCTFSILFRSFQISWDPVVACSCLSEFLSNCILLYNVQVTMEDRFDVERILNTAQIYGLAPSSWKFCWKCEKSQDKMPLDVSLAEDSNL